MSESRAVIFGAAGHSLTEAETAFFGAVRPWGFILFARNLADPDQIRGLVAEMRATTGRSDVPVFLDQEGGRVQRLRPPLAPRYPAAEALGAIHRVDPRAGRRAAWLMSRLHAFDLVRYGINADCLPVLDVPVEGADGVIGDRAYARNPAVVAEMGEAAAEGLLAGGVLPVAKHMPGHGRAFADSHLALPVVDASLDDLRAHDFVPFMAMTAPLMAMTAHVVYSAIDPGRPATISPVVVGDIIRGELGFDGLLMSDDVSMKALTGTFGDKTSAIFAAGCDIVLHCNGLMEEMEAVAAEAPMLSGRSLERAQAALKPLGTVDDAVEADIRAEFDAMFEAVA